MKKGIYGQSNPLDPVTRYAKNFKKHGKDFSVVLFTKESDITKVERFMANVVKEAKKEDVTKALTSASMSHMEYIGGHYEENK